MAAITVACALTVAAGTSVNAQIKVIPGEHRTMTATVESVDQGARTITVRSGSGELRTIQAPDQATRLAEIKPGDTVTATYYDNIVLRVKQAGEPDVDTREAAVTPGTAPRPVGTSATQQTITATIDAIDMNVPSISFKGPRNWTYSTKVQDKKALSQVKAGDRVDITWTEATLVNVAPGTSAAAPAKK
jgi:hypothetical protein